MRISPQYLYKFIKRPPKNLKIMDFQNKYAYYVKNMFCYKEYLEILNLSSFLNLLCFL